MIDFDRRQPLSAVTVDFDRRQSISTGISRGREKEEEGDLESHVSPRGEKEQGD
ncbi:hypothetical protein B296_00011024, partial [Ensete ventricosum]